MVGPPAFGDWCGAPCKSLSGLADEFTRCALRSGMILNRGQTNLETLIIQNKLTVVPQLDVNFPGSNIEKDALGYLHANCGNCHNDSPDGIPHNDLNLWVNTFDSTVEQTGTWKTAVNQPTSGFKDQHTTLRIDTINPQKSALLYRMTERGNIAQMPPIASTIHDLTGIETVRAWIEELQ